DSRTIAQLRQTSDVHDAASLIVSRPLASVLTASLFPCLPGHLSPSWSHRPPPGDHAMHHAPWTLDPTRILTRRELAAVLADLRAKAPHSANARRNLIILRLSCC